MQQSIYIYIFLFWHKFTFREIRVQTQLVKKNCSKNIQKKFHFQDWGTVDFMICLTPKIMVTQYQPRVNSFVITWHHLITFISHCLKILHKPNKIHFEAFKCVYTNNGQVYTINVHHLIYFLSISFLVFPCLFL